MEAGGTGLKVAIKRVHTVAKWSWEVTDEVCGICRNPFDGCCTDCRAPGEDCPPVWGACRHAFHMHCILKWVNAKDSDQSCPMCRRPWEFQA